MKIYRNNTLVADVVLKDNSYISDEIMGARLLSISFDVLRPIDFEINDYTDFEGERYKIRHAESVKKDQTFSGYSYTISLYGSQYELQNTVFFLHGKPERLKHGATFRGTASKILELIVANMNRNDSGWAVGNSIETAEETFDFTDMSCGSVLDAVVKQFNTEYYINGRIISIGRQSYPAHDMVFGYGKGRGFRELEVMATEDQPPLTVLYPYGSDRNLNPEYGSDYLLLPGGQLSLEKNVAKYGRIERSKQFEHIYPKGIFKVSRVDANDPTVFYADESLNFDLSAYLLDETDVIVTFQDGKLAGYDLAVVSEEWDKSNKKIKVKPHTDETAMEIPSATNTCAPGDTFILTNLRLPQEYIDKAEQQLLEEAKTYLNDYCEKRVQLRCKCDDVLFRQKEIYMRPGQMVRVKYEPLELDREIRCTGIKKYIENNEQRSYRYELTLSDFLQGNNFKDWVEDVKKYPDEIKQEGARAKAYAQRNYRDVMELYNNLYDPEGDYFEKALKPLAIETLQLVVGSPSLQFKFILSNGNTYVPSFYYNKASRVFVAEGSILRHLTLGINKDMTTSAKQTYLQWNISGNSFGSLDPDKCYYLYAVCNKSAKTGYYRISEKPIKLEEESNVYHFWVGFLNSMYEGDRSFRTVYGYTEIIGGNVTTDRIISSDSKTYFDLNKGEIGGKILFTSGSSGMYNLDEWPTLDKNIKKAQETADIANKNAIDMGHYAQQGAKDSMANRLGYENFADLEAQARKHGTLIDGGLIRTGLIDAEAIVTKELVARYIDADYISSKNIVTKNLTVKNGAKIGDFDVHSDFLKYEKKGNSIYLGDNIYPASSNYTGMMKLIDNDTNRDFKAIIYIDSAPPSYKNLLSDQLQNVAVYVRRGGIRVQPENVMDIPGLIFAGRVWHDQSLSSNQWGKKGRGKLSNEYSFAISYESSTKIYKITHYLEHEKYYPQITPWGSSAVKPIIHDIKPDFFTFSFVESNKTSTKTTSGFCLAVFGENT